jgi:hypothetical protein
MKKEKGRLKKGECSKPGAASFTIKAAGFVTNNE